MDSLFWPGEYRARAVFTEHGFLQAMVAVESAWAGHALPVPDTDLDVESGGNPVIALVDALRAANPDVDIHTGLTSQDVVDTALMLLLRDGVQHVLDSVNRALAGLEDLDSRYGQIPLVGRTLTQWALPITLGHKLSSWSVDLSEAACDLTNLSFPVQVGGPVGLDHDSRAIAEELKLAPANPWHTHRRPITRAGDALVAVTDACGHLARDVLTLTRPEIGELSVKGGGTSSSMPHKANPVLAVLVRRAALSTPGLAATLHLCASDQVDERADGAWHAEWETLRTLVRRTVVAADQTADVVEALEVHADRMEANLRAAGTARQDTR